MGEADLLEWCERCETKKIPVIPHLCWKCLIEEQAGYTIEEIDWP